MEQNIRLMIVDDNQFFRECLALVLTGQCGFTIADLAASPEDTLIKVKAQEPDIVLISVHLSYSALELAKLIGLEAPHVKLIIFGVDELDPSILEYLEAGSSGYIPKGTSLDGLKRIIYSVHRGETRYPIRLAYSLLPRSVETSVERANGNGNGIKAEDLTFREVEILRLVADGLSNKEIAERLFLSLHTVKNHVHNILSKLQVHNRSEVVRYAMERGFMRRRYIF